MMTIYFFIIIACCSRLSLFFFFLPSLSAPLSIALPLFSLALLARSLTASSPQRYTNGVVISRFSTNVTFIKSRVAEAIIAVRRLPPVLAAALSLSLSLSLRSFARGPGRPMIKIYKIIYKKARLSLLTSLHY
jgi:hypothetical protein